MAIAQKHVHSCGQNNILQDSNWLKANIAKHFTVKATKVHYRQHSKRVVVA